MKEGGEEPVAGGPWGRALAGAGRNPPNFLLLPWKGIVLGPTVSGAAAWPSKRSRSRRHRRPDPRRPRSDTTLYCSRQQEAWHIAAKSCCCESCAAQQVSPSAVVHC